MPPIWREARLGLELTSLLRDPIFDGASSPAQRAAGAAASGLHGRRRLARHDDDLASPDGQAPAQGGHPLERGLRGPDRWRASSRASRRSPTREGPVAIVGQSRGGLFARVLAVRRPELVSRNRDARLRAPRPARGPSRSCGFRSTSSGCSERSAPRGSSAPPACRGECCADVSERARGPISRRASASSRFTHAATGSSTGAPVSTPPRAASRSTRATAA